MNRKMRFISFFIIVTILFSMISLPIYADETEDAIKLQTIGILKGSGNGVDEAYRSSEPMRYQAAWLFLRLLGKESVAKAWTGTLNFADSATAKTTTGNTLNSENKTMLAYLYAHQNLGFKGFTDDTFRPFEKINAQQYYKLMLVALGYEENTDFTWDTVFKNAARFGLSTEVETNNAGFNIDRLARITVAALNANLKSTERTLIAKLIEDDKSIDITKAAQAGLYGDIVVPETEEPTTNPGNGVLSSVEIGKLSDAVVLISAVGYDGSKWNGSGFYTSQDGNLVTNYHVIDGAKTLTITENDGQVYTGSITITGFDENEDIAALDIDRTVKLYLKTGNSDNVVVGEQIFAIGSPYGLKNTLSEGLISALRENGDIQISAAISQGSSGGVLLNNRGEAIGITYAAIIAGENLGFAVPINKYLNMYKGLQLDIASLYSQVYAVQKPANVYVTMIDSNSVSIKWSEVIGADYYRIYSSTNTTGTYAMIKDANGNGNWSWDNGAGITYNQLTPGITYYIKVTAVKGSIESIPSDITTFSLAAAATLSYDDYSSYILSTQEIFSCGGYTTRFSTVEIEDSTSTVNHLNTWIYLDNDYMFDAITMFAVARTAVESKLYYIASDISSYYKKDVTIFITYSDYYDTYPSPWVDNDLYDDTVSYNYSLHKWQVFYPFVFFDFYYTNSTYTSYWDY